MAEPSFSALGLQPQHGGTDAGPEPLWDFSTNANPLGPCPAVLEAVHAADLTRYPDPHYTRLRAALAAYHRTDPACIVIGAGASELILRLVRATPGPMLVLGPSFSEYTRCARVEAREVIEVTAPSDFLGQQRRQQGDGLGFVCWPNNPTGESWPAEFLANAASGGRVVVDFAYAAMGPEDALAAARAATTSTIQLYAPNKSFGLTGLRAAYAVTPRPWPELSWLAASWPVGPAGVAFLEAVTSEAAQSWLAECRPVLAGWRRSLAAGLAEMGLEVRESPATFLMARVGDASPVAAALRRHGLRVRDATSFGLPAWIRLGAAPPEWQAALLAALAKELRR
ncbi:Histidinol-phosphate aminotransferase family protein [Rhodovastum atsumiense]|uniref:histidinol-phosphate transaminase n=1 Tax=Rhodovastum atsumiense TaxID=504468 RepID=A0A5M6IWY1_9PROT|nr:histidinol-phosphate transaminase [Rhodovastum atsumiense]KAA5612823.1 histidinol-phosphate aminotransferase family protein [Rhodovastum atsumiense]CAH2601112.1 Histidinol-phosphate aminotransferase family protein [Rhodovastum atsumiense]